MQSQRSHKVTWVSRAFTLAGNVVVEPGNDLSGERKNALVGGVGAFAGVNGSDDAYQGAVAAVHLDRVLDQIVLGPIFAGHSAIMRPIPVQHNLPKLSFGNDYAVRGKRRVPRKGKSDLAAVDREPSRSGKAMQRGVNGIARALAGKRGDKKILPRVLIRVGEVVAHQEFARAQDLEGLRINGLVSSVPWTQLRGK